MGDARRFDLFASLIEEVLPDRSAPIADVAGGKGHLRAALHQRGYRGVVTCDVRREQAKGRPGHRWGLFRAATAPGHYAAAVGMHPDGATDEIIAWACLHRRPFLVCPCCIVPSSAAYWGRPKHREWVGHLAKLASDGGMSVTERNLPMMGRSTVLVGLPI